ncbi:SDR family oxidoreductase [Paenibacillus pinistramenti]|uniref:SDR family oxidoreductase n=1 Tax=Paenibacillus pinistramenti TaxID=1768003 RepID=UPI001109CDC0|nr:SDR family oxidoreductase [Paenibacillus pinistramenti]
MKTCIISGASKGIGRAIAIELSKSERSIEKFILISRSITELEKTKGFMDTSSLVELYSIDFANIEETQEQLASLFKDNDADILINCAGYVEPRSILETTIENWETTFKVNVSSMFLITKEAVKTMKSSGGKIINISSTAGMSARPGWSAYAASKAAVINFSETLSEELKEYGIKVYCVSPGRCATDLRKKLAPNEDPSTIMQPEDIAGVVRSLIPASGDFLDGQNIVVRQQVKSY